METVDTLTLQPTLYANKRMHDGKTLSMVLKPGTTF